MVSIPGDGMIIALIHLVRAHLWSDYDSYEPTTIHKILMTGVYTVRRMSRIWIGLERSLVNQQCMVRLIKLIYYAQHAFWSLSHPVLADVNLSIKELTSVGNMTSEQHNDQSISRI